MNQEYVSINSESPRQPQGYPQVHPPQAQPVFMPVYTNNQVVQETPQGIQRTQPVASRGGCKMAANLTLEQTKEEMMSVKKRVKCTSRTLMLAGFAGLGLSIWQCYHARQISLNVILGRKAFGPPEPPVEDAYGYPDHDAQKQREAELGAQTMTRDELAVYDLMKTISFLVFLVSFLTFGLGKLGMRTVWREKSQCAHRVSKKSFVALVFIFIFGMLVRNQGGELHKIIKRNKNGKNITPIQTIINQTDSFNLSEPIGRNLKGKHHREQEEELYFGYGDDVEDICEALDNDGCESDDRCSWCKSGAVPPACKSVTVAKTLPAAVFICDNLDASEEEFIPREDKGHGKHHGKGHKGKDHHKKDGKHGKGHHGKHEKTCCMKYAGMIYAITLFVHMCNLRCYYNKLNAWESKRVQAGEVLSDDGWGCGPWKKNWKKKQGQRRANQTATVQSNDESEQIDSSSNSIQ